MTPEPRIATSAERWRVACLMAEHLLFCWPRRLKYERLAWNRHRKECLRCGLVHEWTRP